MNEPTVKIINRRQQRIFVCSGEALIVSPERAEALGDTVTIAVASLPSVPSDRMVRSPLRRSERPAATSVAPAANAKTPPGS